MVKQQKVWAIIPAGGVGIRMAADKPKQYLQVLGRSVLHHTLSRICSSVKVNGVVVGTQASDHYWYDNPFENIKLLGNYDAGETRAKTVLNGLYYLCSFGQVSDDDWALVHDAVRPCITQQDIARLVEAACENGKGAVLGSKLMDTLKSTDHRNNITDTIARDRIWQAFTPQIFRIGELIRGITESLAAGIETNDESMAMERTGHFPVMVQGHPKNIKITIDSDLDLLDLYLKALK